MLVGVNDRAKLLTQTDFIRYLYEHDTFSQRMRQSVKDAGLHHPDIGVRLFPSGDNEAWT